MPFALPAEAEAIVERAKRNEAPAWPSLRSGRLVIVYEDAASLQRGFQFWMWLVRPGTAEITARCVPVRLSQAAGRPELDDLLRSPEDTSFFIFSVGSARGLSNGGMGRLVTLLKRDRCIQKGLIILCATEKAWTDLPRRWLVPGKLRLPLGCFLAFPAGRRARTGTANPAVASYIMGSAGPTRAASPAARSPAFAHGLRIADSAHSDQGQALAADRSTHACLSRSPRRNLSTHCP